MEKIAVKDWNTLFRELKTFSPSSFVARVVTRGEITGTKDNPLYRQGVEIFQLTVGSATAVVKRAHYLELNYRGLKAKDYATLLIPGMLVYIEGTGDTILIRLDNNKTKSLTVVNITKLISLGLGELDKFLPRSLDVLVPTSDQKSL